MGLMPRGNRCHGKDNYNRERGMWGDQEAVRVGEGAGHVLPGQNILDGRETSTKSLGQEV